MVVDKEALRRRYREERDKRLRPDGSEQVWAEGGMSKGPFVPVSVVAGQVVTLNLVVDSGIR